MSQSNLNLSQDSDDALFSAQDIEQALDILGAEVANLSDAQSQETALANVNLLRNLMKKTGVVSADAASESFPNMGSERMSILGPNGSNGVGDAANRAMDVASRVQNLGFVEFTAGLINGTFDAIIGATIKQMEAYANLVADLAKTLAEFQAENVSDAQINAHLSSRYPDGKGGTSVNSDHEFKETDADTTNGIAAKTGAENMRAVIDALVLETAGLGANRLTHVQLGVQDTMEDPSDGKKQIPKVDKDKKPVYKDHAPLKFTASTLDTTDKDGKVTKAGAIGEVELVRKAIGMMLASSMMDNLRAMAREGMARIVITEGELETKLTFQVTSTEEQKTQQAKYHQDGFSVGVRARAGWGWGSASVGANYANLNVNTVNETSTASISMTTEMIGKVKIKFRTETFAPIVAG
jgi:hypothetical protein